jgi:hypothetical protein
MIQEDIDEAQKKVEKKLSKKVKVSRKASLTEETSISSVNVEATIESKKSKKLKKSAIESVNASASFKKNSEKKTQKIITDESSQLTISRKKQIIDSDSDSSELEEVIKEYFEVTSREDLEKLKNNEEFLRKLNSLQIEKFGNFSEALKDFVIILFMLEKGVNIKDINLMFEEDFFPRLISPNFQNALVRFVEKRGHGQYVSEILDGKTVNEIEEKLVKTLGWNSFSKMYESNPLSLEDIINSIETSDFEMQ